MNDRDGECENKGDQYNVGFGDGYTDSGQTKDECNDINKQRYGFRRSQVTNQDNIDSYYDDGFGDGQNNPFDQEIKHAEIMVDPTTKDS